MLLKRIYDDKLAQASYLLGCQATGEALVIDPNRDVEQYLAAAKAEGVRVTHVTETHIHADFASGSRELAERAGAALLLSDCGGADWKYGFADEAGARLLREGDVFMIGNVRVEVRHTPGHTPEHIIFLVTDTRAAATPVAVFTGDFVFVGDVGRPDLLERAANVRGSMEAGARELFRSLQRFKELPDHLQVWPGHGAGSACGKALGAMPGTTVGYERIANWAFGIDDEAAFVREVLSGQPEPPRYFARMKQINRDGVPALGAAPAPRACEPDALPRVIEAGALVIDTRPTAAYAAGHVPGTINVPYGRNFTTYGGALVDYDRDAYLLVHDGGEARAREAARDLALIGFDRVAGWFDATAFARAGARRTIRQTTAAELAPALARGDVNVVDVRNPGEWSAGHIPGVPNVPLGQLANRVAELPRDKPLVLQCQGGGRSAIAASLLANQGFEVINLSGGFGGWAAAGQPIETPADD